MTVLGEKIEKNEFSSKNYGEIRFCDEFLVNFPYLDLSKSQFLADFLPKNIKNNDF